MTVVYPVPAKKTVAWLTEEGEVTPAHKSPLKPTAGSVLPELYQLGELLFHPNLRLCVLLLEVEEYRLLNGWSRDKKRGSTRFDRLPVSLLGEVWVRSPQEYGKLLPPGLPVPFTSRELGKAAENGPDALTDALNRLGLDDAAACSAASFLRRQIDATGGLPDDRTIVVERFTDHTGSNQVYGACAVWKTGQCAAVASSSAYGQAIMRN